MHGVPPVWAVTDASLVCVWRGGCRALTTHWNGGACYIAPGGRSRRTRSSKLNRPNLALFMVSYVLV